jgi:hypothetical protein
MWHVQLAARHLQSAILPPGCPNFGALLLQGTLAAAGAGGADMFAKGNEQPIDFQPILPGQFFFQNSHCFFRRCGLHISPTVGDAVDMDVYTDAAGLAAADAQCQIGAFGANAMKGEKQGTVAGELVVILGGQCGGNGVDLPGFVLVQAYALDEGVYFFNGEGGDGGGGVGAGKEGTGRWQHHFVACANGEDAPDELFEWGVVAFFCQLKHGGFGKRPYRLCHQVHYLINVHVLHLLFHKL